MPGTSYYFVNHTLSEFCSFDANIPIFHAIEKTLTKWPEWKKEHYICILAEQYCRNDEVDILLHERGYRWLDVDAAAAAAAAAVH